MSKDGTFYTVNLNAKKSRKVYFTAYADMEACLNKILELQGFGKQSRLAQYKIIKTTVEASVGNS